MRRLIISRLGMVLGAALALAACGPGEIGQDCHDGVAENDCVDGAICTADATMSVDPPEDPNADKWVCRQLCEIQANCPEGFLCRRAEGTMLSSCQPDPDYVAPPTE